jgi:hypothetical protein
LWCQHHNRIPTSWRKRKKPPGQPGRETPGGHCRGYGPLTSSPERSGIVAGAPVGPLAAAPPLHVNAGNEPGPSRLATITPDSTDVSARLQSQDGWAKLYRTRPPDPRVRMHQRPPTGRARGRSRTARSTGNGATGRQTGIRGKQLSTTYPSSPWRSEYGATANPFHHELTTRGNAKPVVQCFT